MCCTMMPQGTDPAKSRRFPCYVATLAIVIRMSFLDSIDNEFVVHTMCLVCNFTMLLNQPESRVFTLMMITLLYFLFSWTVDLRKSGVNLSWLLLLFSCFSALVVTVDILCRLKDSQEKKLLKRLVHRADELIAEVEAILTRRVN